MSAGSFTVSAVNPDGSLIVTQPISTTLSGQPNVNAIPAKDPLVTGVYSFSAQDIAGLVAATNYVVLFNPVGSGKNVLPLSTTVSDYIVTGSVGAAHSLTLQRCTLVSGGTLQASSAINKLNSSYANPAAQVYTGNPTLTAGPSIVAIPPSVNTAGSAVILEHLSVPLGSGPFILAPGEGVAFSMAIGFANLNFNVAFTWGEM
jgi:hypothetical protein